MKISQSWVKTDEKTNKSYLYTQYEDKKIKVEAITSQEAAEFVARNGF